jgi:ORF6N domain
MKTKRPISSLICNLRGRKVILDADLAELYGVPTKVFNQAVKRNMDRFPEDFCFQLTAAEWTHLKSQILNSNSETAQQEQVMSNWSQFVTSSKRHRGAAYRPTAFTEHGAIMAGNRVEKPRSRGHERVCSARIHADARATGGERGHSQTTRGN